MIKPTRISMSKRDDSLYEASLHEVTPWPVFILGLSRSGTTFLYQTLADVFPIASLTVYHVIEYDRILLYHKEGKAAAAARELDKMFRSWNMATRLTDSIPLSHAMLEEYGWVLKRRAGAFHTNTKTASQLQEICGKLQFISPSAKAILLKNPWDTGHASNILDIYPDARFIFLQRDPVAIVNSQFRIAKYFSETKDPFVNMLLKGIPLGQAWMWLQRAVRKAAGKRWHARAALRYILRTVTRELFRLETSWDMVASHQRIAFDYTDLVNDQAGVLKKVSAFLGLPPRSDPSPEKPNPRAPVLLPEVAAAEAVFRLRLEETGIAQKPLDEIRKPISRIQG